VLGVSILPLFKRVFIKFWNCFDWNFFVFQFSIKCKFV